MSKRLRIGDVYRPDDRPLIAIPMQVANSQELQQFLAMSKLPDVDVIEWRIDAWQDTQTLTETVIKTAIEQCVIPIILTWRTADEGGLKAYNKIEYTRIYTVGIQAGVGAIDIEVRYMHDLAPLLELAHRCGIPVIGSRHDWEWPVNMIDRLTSLNEEPVDVMKYAVSVETKQQASDLLMATKTLDQMVDKPLITMGMGPQGSITRLLGFDYGSQLTFAHLGTASAPGQLSLDAVLHYFNPVASEE